jgi:hypothetical protein
VGKDFNLRYIEYESIVPDNFRLEALKSVCPCVLTESRFQSYLVCRVLSAPSQDSALDLSGEGSGISISLWYLCLCRPLFVLDILRPLGNGRCSVEYTYPRSASCLFALTSHYQFRLHKTKTVNLRCLVRFQVLTRRV